MSLKLETLLHDRYRIESLLGQGGMGAVYKAFDTLYDAECAIKELDLAKYQKNSGESPEDSANPAMITRDKVAYQFKREAKILANLDHPNLPKVTDFFSTEKDLHYLVMTLVNGKDLASMMETRRGQPYPEKQLLEWIGQVMNALSYCHKQNVAHRDIKPANIIITDSNKAYLVDFGVAKNINKVATGTTIGTQILTPKYSPPEQYTGQGMTDARSDIYSLGATMYTLLTGKQPIESILRVMGNEMPTPRQIVSTLSPVLDAVIKKAMSLKQEERFQTIEEMRTAIFADPFLLSTTYRSRSASKEPNTIKISKYDDNNDQGQKKTSAILEIINRPLINNKIIFSIIEPLSKIGRAAGTTEIINIDLTPLDQGRIVSRVHAIIVCRNGHYLIKDNNSHNGTWVNGQRLVANQDYLLNDGDDIRFGSQHLHGIQAIFRQSLSE